LFWYAKNNGLIFLLNIIVINTIKKIVTKVNDSHWLIIIEPMSHTTNPPIIVHILLLINGVVLNEIIVEQKHIGIQIHIISPADSLVRLNV
jgi:hypothetical protein